MNKIERMAPMVAMILLGYLLFLAWNEGCACFVPDYPQLELTAAVEERDYPAIFRQTGLTRSAADEMLQTEGIAGLKRFQAQFFAPRQIRCDRLSVTTMEEHLTDPQGGDWLTELAPVRTGDILVALSTHTVGWRHGHCALVVDAQQGITLESVMVGRDSMFQDINKWRRFPAFAVLRPREGNSAVMDGAVAYALQNLEGLPYHLLAGIVPGDRGTQCAHLVRAAYLPVGVDLGGGLVVTPRDILVSDALKVVQIYGMNPEEFIERME